MGPSLGRPLMSQVIERTGNGTYECSICEVNGLRNDMEDAHAITFEEEYAFFGVFDGHGGSLCSAFIADAMPPLLKAATHPLSDQDLMNICVESDGKWIASHPDHQDGSTGTFLLSKPIEGKAGHFSLQIGNVGDSRIVIGRVKDGKVTCEPVTTDHKPTDPEETARITKYGGFVTMGRVDGNLAVARAFGDNGFKKGEGGPLEQKLIASPDVTHADIGPQDFVLIFCDGVYESDFTNEQIIDFAHERLKKGWETGRIAARICHEAIYRGSGDNITCMVLLPRDGTTNGAPRKEIIPGAWQTGSQFEKQYELMAGKVNMSAPEAWLRRYELLPRLIEEMRQEFDEGSGPMKQDKGQLLGEWQDELADLEASLANVKDGTKEEKVEALKVKMESMANERRPMRQ